MLGHWMWHWRNSPLAKNTHCKQKLAKTFHRLSRSHTITWSKFVTHQNDAHLYDVLENPKCILGKGWGVGGPKFILRHRVWRLIPSNQLLGFHLQASSFRVQWTNQFPKTSRAIGNSMKHSLKIRGVPCVHGQGSIWKPSGILVLHGKTPATAWSLWNPATAHRQHSIHLLGKATQKDLAQQSARQRPQCPITI